MQVLKEETRNQILESTRQDIITYGIDNVSLRRIARNIGMSPSNIYNYFKNKEELIESIVLPGIQQIDKLFSDISNNRLEFNLKEINNSKSDFAKLSVEQLAVKIFELYKKLDVAVIIILGSEQYIESINKWICNTLYNNYEHYFVDECNEYEKKFFAELISFAIIQGFKKVLDNAEYCIENNIDVPKMLERYLKIFLG